MDWLCNFFCQSSVPQTILLLTLISIIGLALGRVKLAGVSLGSSFVFFAAIAAGHFTGKWGIETNPAMMDFVKNFGLIIFVYTLGLQCGPGFFSSLRKGGIKFILSALAIILIGSAISAVLVLTGILGTEQSVGLLSGAVTSTPALIAAQQTVLDLKPGATGDAAVVGSAYAVGYPFSILSITLCVIVMKRLFPKSAERSSGHATDMYTAVTEVVVCNKALFGKSIEQIVKDSGFHFVISRLWRSGNVRIPVGDTVVNKGDHLLLICSKDDMHRFGDVFGQEEATDWNRPDIDWDVIDKKLVSMHLRVTKESATGISLKKLKLRNKYGVNITRINRAGITLVPSADTTLQFGDRLTVVGDEDRIKQMGKVVGNEETRLNEPRLIPILSGIFLGVLLGSIPIVIPGISTPLKLGIAGGPIIMGILMGAFGPSLHITTYTTRAANLMLRQMGITFFFASLGLGVGAHFVETVFCAQGLKWAALAVAIAMIPALTMGIFNEKVLKMDFAKNIGVITGTYANPNALSYANSMLDNDNAAESYATVYPITTFLRVAFSQLLIILLGL